MTHRILMIVTLCCLALGAQAGIKTEEISYRVGDNEFTGYLAYDDQISAARPGILIVHEWWGHVAYARKRAEMLAKLGYTAFALDMYGTGNVAKHPDTAKKFMQSVLDNMPEAEKRFTTALEILRKHTTVDKQKVAAIGYCFGGGFALEMARAGIDLDGVVSVHGSLGTKNPAKAGQVKAKILVLTGAEDAFVPPEQVQAFEKEMNAAKVRYELKSYPGAKHAFSNPEADYYAKQFAMPLAYNEAADKASWQRIQGFLNDIFQ